MGRYCLFSHRGRMDPSSILSAVERLLGVSGVTVVHGRWNTSDSRSDAAQYCSSVKPEAQWYLVETLSNARGRLGLHDDYEAKRNQLSRFAGALAAFRYLGSVTQQEEEDWNRRMCVALGYEVPESPPSSASGSIYVLDHSKPHLPQPPSAPVFIRSQSGPNQEFEIHGGKLWILAVEFYDSATMIKFRVSPEPGIASVFSEEAAALERDLVGLEDWAAEDLRKKAHDTLATMRLYSFGLRDDLGTSYAQLGLRLHNVGFPSGMTGEAEYQAPLPEASLLVFSWLGLEVPIPMN